MVFLHLSDSDDLSEPSGLTCLSCGSHTDEEDCPPIYPFPGILVKTQNCSLNEAWCGIALLRELVFVVISKKALLGR